jgi:hypothetical protein
MIINKETKKKAIFFTVIGLLLFSISACEPSKNNISNANEEMAFSSLNEFYSYLNNNFKESNLSKTGNKYVLSGDLIVKKGISLDINNEILEIDSLLNRKHGIYVYGTLNIINKSIITAVNKDDGSYSFWYNKDSNGEIKDSTVEYTWTGKGKANEAGLFVESDYFEISDSTIQYSKGNGIDFQGKNIIIHDSSFKYNGVSGIEIFSPSDLPIHFEIYNNQINNNGMIESRLDGCGILIDNSEGLAYNNTIFENRYCGFETDCRGLNSFCVIKIYNNNVYNNGHDGLFVHENSDATAYNNIIKGNRRGVSIDNYQTGYETRLNLYNNTLTNNKIGVEITENYDSNVELSNNILDYNEIAIKIQNSNPKMFNNIINGEVT